MTEAQRLIAEAATAAEQSYSPYSNYRVGAVVVATDGTEYLGCNVENAAYGASICAEANAITNAAADGIRAIISQTLFKRIDRKGRIPAMEILIATPAVRNLIRESKSHQLPSMMQTGKKYGMQLLDEAIMDLYNKGWITGDAAYIKARLKDVFQLAYDRPNMHECVFSDKLQADRHVTTIDMAKRLMDYGFHPPTVYFPLVVPGAIMIEPTETESKAEIDRFIERGVRLAPNGAFNDMGSADYREQFSYAATRLGALGRLLRQGGLPEILVGLRGQIVAQLLGGRRIGVGLAGNQRDAVDTVRLAVAEFDADLALPVGQQVGQLFLHLG